MNEQTPGPFGERALEGDAASLSDIALCQAVREGELWPLATLWERYYGVALSWARRKDPTHAEDAVASAFDDVFQALIQGGGPTESFTGYLFRSISSQFAVLWKAGRRIEPLDDVEVEDRLALGSDEMAMRNEEAGAAAEAIEELPLRWKQIILAVDVGGRPVQEVAEELRLSPNSASVLLKRARIGLKKSWLLKMHRPRELEAECAACVAEFGDIRWGRRNGSKRLRAEAHLESCPHCTKRWQRFVEQAAIIGMVSTGILALGQKSRAGVFATAAAFTSALLIVVSSTAPILLKEGVSAAPVEVREMPGSPGTTTGLDAQDAGNTETSESAQASEGRADPSGDGTGAGAGSDAREQQQFDRTPASSAGPEDDGRGLPGSWVEEIPNSANVNVNDIDGDGDGVPGMRTNTVWTRWGGATLRKVDVDRPGRGLPGATFVVWASSRPAGCRQDPDLMQLSTAAGVPYRITSDARGEIVLDGVWIGNEGVADGAAAGQQQRCYVLEEVSPPDGYLLPRRSDRLTEVVVGIGATNQTSIVIPGERATIFGLLAQTGMRSPALILAVGAALILTALMLHRRSRVRE